MAEPTGGYRVFRPGRQAAVHYMWAFCSLAAGMAFLGFFHRTWLQVGAGVVLCVVGLWQFLCTLSVLRTHFVVTDQEILSVSPLCLVGLRWAEIAHVLVRQRSRGMQPGRADRAVLLTTHSARELVLNTSVLSQHDETRLLNEIRSRVNCTIEIVTDGLLPRRTPKGLGT